MVYQSDHLFFGSWEPKTHRQHLIIAMNIFSIDNHNNVYQQTKDSASRKSDVLISTLTCLCVSMQ